MGSHSAMVGELLPNHVTYTGQRLGWEHSPRPKPIHREAVEIEGEKGVLAALLPAQPHTHQAQGRRNRGGKERSKMEICFTIGFKTTPAIHRESTRWAEGPLVAQCANLRV